MTLSLDFPLYTAFNPHIPVYCATPEISGAIHRFFDTSPFSPSGRYLAVTRLPVEHRSPKPGEAADIILVDLQNATHETVAQTRGWDTQLGAQLQWGHDDESLFFNDVDIQTWKPYGVNLNPHTRERKRLGGTVYMISPDGRWAASPCLIRIGLTQPGYGVVVPRGKIPRKGEVPNDDGLFLTNTKTGDQVLLASIEEIFHALVPVQQRDRYRDGAFYVFHVKWNPQGTRLMIVLRWLPHESSWIEKKMERVRVRLLRRPGKKARPIIRHVITMDAAGRNMHMTIPNALWQMGGHHPNWCPDGEHLIMNLNLRGDGMRFIKVRYDGSNLHLLSETLLGSGHPTLHPDGCHILADAYNSGPFSFGDGTTPIRWVDLGAHKEKHLLRIRTKPQFTGKNGELRVDPHPAWDRGYRRIAFNACPDGTRRVYIADLESEISSS